MPHRYAEQLRATTVGTAAVVVGDEFFRFLVAPVVLIFVMVGIGFVEAWLDHRVQEMESTASAESRRPKASVNFRKAGWAKLENVAMVMCGAGMDVSLWVLSNLAPEKFPWLPQLHVPVITIGWTLWLMWGEAKDARANYGKLKGRGRMPPFPDIVQRVVGRLLTVDASGGSPPPPRRRKIDHELARAAEELGVQHAEPATPPETGATQSTPDGETPP